MDLIETIRHMMAEENFSGAEIALETAISTASADKRNGLVQLYLQTLLHQKKSLPDHLVAETLNPVFEADAQQALVLFENASTTLQTSHDSRVLFFRMRLAEKRGHIKELHDLISDYHLRLYERSLPAVPKFVDEMVQKYFRTDFQLKLQAFALTLVRKDNSGAESQIRHLILEAYEKSTPKILKQKLDSLLQVLNVQTEKVSLEIYQSLLHVIVNGFTEKRDYKRLAETVIYFGDFRFNVIVMNILVANHLEDLATDYSRELAGHAEYDFVYIAKHFPDLKKYFVTLTSTIARSESWESPDLTLEERPSQSIYVPEVFDQNEDEVLLIHLIRNQEFTDTALLDLSVSFVQSELPKVAVAAAMMVHERSSEPKLKMKAAYLALTSLLLVGDYRKALDLALESMKLVETTDDLLSFLYCEAEAYIRLGLKKEAKQVLQKIVSIDSRYRMARERLEKL